MSENAPVDRIKHRVEDLEASLYGQRSYAQAITNVSSSLAKISSSLSSSVSTLSVGVSTSLSSAISTLSTGVSSSLSSGLSTLSTGVSSSLSSGLSTLSTGVSTSLSSGLSTFLTTGHSWAVSQVFPEVNVNGAAATNRIFKIQTGGVDRWWIYGLNDPETGSNTGTDLAISSFDDTGAFLSTPIFCARATGLVTCADGLTVASSTFSVLPNPVADGQRRFIRDSTVAAAGNFGAAAAGGGTNHVPVYFETGTNTWRIG